MTTCELLINEIKTDDSLQKLLADAVEDNDLDAFLKKTGCDVAPEDSLSVHMEQAEMLDDSAMDQVTGGVHVRETVLSFFMLCSHHQCSAVRCWRRP